MSFSTPLWSGSANSAIDPEVVILPILPPYVPSGNWTSSVNHKAPSGPAVICCGELPALRPAENSVIFPSASIRPIRRPSACVNHMPLSGPAVMPIGLLPGRSSNSTIAPVMLMRPIRWPVCSVNHMLPSGPLAIRCGRLPAFGSGYSVIAFPVALQPASARKPARIAIDWSMSPAYCWWRPETVRRQS